MLSFLRKYYPLYWDRYHTFRYDVQRWDAIRYLILDTIGGLYVDFDYECLEFFDEFLKDKQYCFSAEPKEHADFFFSGIYFNNAFIAAVPGHPFIQTIRRAIFELPPIPIEYPNKMQEVLETTGPLFLSELYADYPKKESVFIIPSEFSVDPLNPTNHIDPN